MELKDNDFVEINFDIYANNSLVQTTYEKKGKEANISEKEGKFGPQTIIVGKAFVLAALDEDLKKNSKGENTLELKAEDAYGKKQKELIRPFPKKTFEEQELRAVPGMVYDFNGMYGTVKAVTGGRVLVDFNHPLSGKDIKLEYKVLKKVEDIVTKIEVVIGSVLKIPADMFKVSSKEKVVTLEVPEQIAAVKEMLVKSLEELISDIKEYELKIETFKNK